MADWEAWRFLGFSARARRAGGWVWEARGPPEHSLCFISYSLTCVVISEGRCSQDTPGRADGHE